MSAREGRIAELDALRGFAALAVVFYHFTTRFDQLFGHATPLAAAFPWGEYGVDFFLMLSGFVILRSLDRTRRASDFVVGRAARLYPAYWVAGAITFSVVSWCGLPGQEVSLAEAAANATMLQQQFGARHIDGAYWSLEVELFFYVFALALHVAGAFRNERRLYWALALWLLAEAASVAIVCNFGEDVHRSFAIRAIGKLQVLLSLRYAHLFSIGIVLYRGWRSGRLGPAAWAVLAACWLMQGFVDSWGAALGIAGLTGLLYAAAAGRLSWLAAWPLVLLGGISYPLYLIHQNVGYVAIRQIESRGAGADLAVVAALAISLAAAWGLSRTIEQPLQKGLVGWWKRRSQAQSQGDPLAVAGAEAA
jgi:peptidoglycan/LPS O-acetylase OafA/YrhL